MLTVLIPPTRAEVSSAARLVSWGSNINELPAQLPLEVQQPGAVKAILSARNNAAALLRNGSLALWGTHGVPADVLAGPVVAAAMTYNPGGDRNLAIVLANGSLWCNMLIKNRCSRVVPSGHRVLNVRLAIGAVFVQLEGGAWRVADGLDAPNWQPTNLTDNPAIEPLTAKFGRELPGNWLVSSDPSAETQALVADLRRANVKVVEGCGDEYVLLSNGTVLFFQVLHPNWAQPPDNVQGRIAGMACGSKVNIALLPNGSAVAWGDDNQRYQPPPLPPGRRITAVAVGSRHSLFLLDDGTVVQSGELLTYGPPVPVAAANQPLVDIAAGSGVAVVNAQAGGVISWGEFGYTASIPSAVQSSTIVAVAAGLGTALALSSAGRVYQWGHAPMFEPEIPVEALDGVVAIEADGSSALALLRDGSLVFWDSILFPTNARCVVGGSDTFSGVLRLPWLKGANITAISLSRSTVAAVLSNGSLLHWGCGDTKNWLGQLDVPEDARSGVVETASGNGFNMARTTANKLVIWGNSSVVDNTPTSLLGPDALNITSISAGYDHALALLANGSLVAWGDNMSSPAVRDVPDSVRQGRVVRMSAGSDFSLALVEPREPDGVSPLPSECDGSWDLCSAHTYEAVAVLDHACSGKQFGHLFYTVCTGPV
jgi:hypothetical protein